VWDCQSSPEHGWAIVVKLRKKQLLFSEIDLSLCLLDCRKGGKYFYKRDRGFYQYERPNFLAVEDPQDLGNDLAKGSYAVDKARSLYLPANTWLMCLPERP